MILQTNFPNAQASSSVAVGVAANVAVVVGAAVSFAVAFHSDARQQHDYPNQSVGSVECLF